MDEGERRRIMILRPGLPEAEGLYAALPSSVQGVEYDSVSALPQGPAPLAVVASLDAGGLRIEEVRGALAARGWDSPVIAATADPAPETLLDWLRAGVSGYLATPYEPARVADLFDSVVRTEGTGAPDASMEAVSPVDGWFELSAPSHTEYLERFQRLLATLLGTRLDEATQRQLRMTIYELGQNAIEWGNRNDVGKRVKIAYCLFEDKLVFKIEDEGSGFAWTELGDAAKDPLGVVRKRKAEGKRAGGFGMAMVRRLMDDVIFNEKGNVVLFEKRLPPAAAPGGTL